MTALAVVSRLIPPPQASDANKSLCLLVSALFSVFERRPAMKQRKIDVFERNGHDLLNLALELDSNNKMVEAEGRRERSPTCRARHDAIVAMGALIRAVTALLRS